MALCPRGGFLQRRLGASHYRRAPSSSSPAAAASPCDHGCPAPAPAPAIDRCLGGNVVHAAGIGGGAGSGLVEPLAHLRSEVTNYIKE
jgi:hypothetical protein